MEIDKRSHEWAMFAAQNLLARYLYDKSPEETFLAIGYLIVEMRKHYSYEEVECSNWEQIINEAVSMKITKIIQQ